MITKIRIVAVGRVREKYLREGIDEFLKRIKSFCKVEIIELKDEGMQKEASRQIKYINENAHVLSAEGKQYSSEEFALLLRKAEGEITLLIGGHDGILPQVKRKAKLLSLSKLTFTHEMSRLFLLEQLYRGFMILHNRPYHK
ncbi:23S rRNA (pseudouridine(1915)-N(3))-methyltransferase RlmH [Candidatus Woesearchaeota archaeon]|nr:23S rRNA (pseudouridine(1915)-N(3))-methyltransferase RlmH [Candidatus Woesearchaeota archaeon]